MKHLSAGPKHSLCANDASIFPYFAWPSVTRLPDGALAMVTSGFRLEHICPFGRGVICYSYDEGKTWTAPAVVMDTPLDDRDCGLTVFGENRAILTSFNNTTDMQRFHNKRRRNNASTALEFAKCDLIDAYLNYVDQLGTQKNYIGSTYRISDDGGYTFGPVRRMPVTAPHGPCRLNDGALLYVGRRFSDDDSFDSGEKPYVEAWTLDETDEPVYLSSIENVSDEHGVINSCEPHAIQLLDGTIIVHIRMERGGEHRFFSVWQSVSTDGGKTWDTDWILDDECPNWDLGYPATVELKDGSLLTVYYQNVDGVSRIMQRVWRLPE